MFFKHKRHGSWEMDGAAQTQLADAVMAAVHKDEHALDQEASFLVLCAPSRVPVVEWTSVFAREALANAAGSDDFSPEDIASKVRARYPDSVFPDVDHATVEIAVRHALSDDPSPIRATDVFQVIEASLMIAGWAVTEGMSESDVPTRVTNVMQSAVRVLNHAE